MDGCLLAGLLVPLVCPQTRACPSTRLTAFSRSSFGAKTTQCLPVCLFTSLPTSLFQRDDDATPVRWLLRLLAEGFSAFTALIGMPRLWATNISRHLSGVARVARKGHQANATLSLFFCGESDACSVQYFVAGLRFSDRVYCSAGERVWRGSTER